MRFIGIVFLEIIAIAFFRIALEIAGLDDWISGYFIGVTICAFNAWYWWKIVYEKT